MSTCLNHVTVFIPIRIDDYWHNTLWQVIFNLLHIRVPLRSELPTFNFCSHGTRSPLRFSRITLENCYYYQDQLKCHLHWLSRENFDGCTLSSYLRKMNFQLNSVSTVWNLQWAQVSSFFRADQFGRWVVTHSFADSDFHGHCPAVYIDQHLSWLLMSCFSTYYPISRFIPDRQFCLPKKAH